MQLVKLEYKKETSLMDAKEQPKFNRCFLVNGKMFRMTPGIHKLPKSDVDKFVNTPVGRMLLDKKIIKVEDYREDKPVKKEDKKSFLSKDKKDKKSKK